MRDERAAAYLRSRGICREELIEAVGAYVAGDNFGDLRCWVAWRDCFGKPVFWQGRAIGKADARYINSPQPMPPLFSSPSAWQAIRVGLCEGLFDALLLEQYGLPAFATGGATLRQGAEAILENKCEVVLFVDNDLAGDCWRYDVIGKLYGKVPLSEYEIPREYKDVGEMLLARKAAR